MDDQDNSNTTDHTGIGAVDSEIFCIGKDGMASISLDFLVAKGETNTFS